MLDQPIDRDKGEGRLPLPGTRSGEGSCEPRTRIVGVTLPPNLKPIKLQGDVPQDFLGHAQVSSLTWLNFTVRDMEREGSAIAATFGFGESLVPTLLKGYLGNFEDRSVEFGILLPAVRVKKAEMACFPLIVLVKKNLILTMHPEDITRLVNFSRYADTFVRKLPEGKQPEDHVTLMLCRIIDENNGRNFEQLREIEDQVNWLSVSLLDPKAQRDALGKSIYEIKHTLISYLNALWSTLDVLNNLRYGDADLITGNPKVLAKVNLLVVDVTQQISLSKQISEILASGLEVLHSINNNQLQALNNRMALAMTWLTILGTAVLVPNTLATIGSLVTMEGDMLTAFLALIGLSTLAATILAWWWVSRKVHLPTRPDEFAPAQGRKGSGK